MSINVTDVILGLGMGWVLGILTGYKISSLKRVKIDNVYSERKNVLKENLDIIAEAPKQVIINLVCDDPQNMDLTDLCEIVLDYDKWKDNKLAEKESSVNPLDELNKIDDSKIRTSSPPVANYKPEDVVSFDDLKK